MRTKSSRGLRTGSTPALAPRESLGFTLVELMVVVIVIAIVASLAIPTMLKGQFDRRVFTDAAALGELVRAARTRAVGRGAAQLVVIQTASATNSLTAQIFESVTNDPSGGGVNTPVQSCNAPTVWPAGLWSSSSSGSNAAWSAGGTAKFIDQFAMGGASSYEARGQIMARMVYPYTASAATVINDGVNIYLCYTPSGRSYISTIGTPTNFIPMSGVLGVQFTREAFPATAVAISSTNLVRTLMIPPTGATRITSH
jgi:prepilin-type N-terminal cleavage/methylation domain-containing protein